MPPKKILIFSQWFLPAYKAGGPIQSVYNLVQRLSEEYDFSIVASDRDLFQTEPLPNVTFNEWTKVNGIPIIYLTPDQQNSSNFKRIIYEGGFDVIYLNSMFALKYAVLPLWIALNLNKKVVLAPRGMLGKGAMKVGRTKKMLFLKVFKLLGWHKKVLWQATADSEQREIKDLFGEKATIKIAPNLSKLMELAPPSRLKEPNTLRLFFLSRIAVKKNLLGALELLQQVPSELKIQLDIIGPSEDEAYWKSCQKAIEKLPESIQVNYKGSVPNLELTAHIKDSHFLFLPTFNENFGHVIMESWQQACPVIISDQTPWRNLETKQIGWDIALNNKAKFVDAIQTAAKMNQEEYNLWSAAAFEHAKIFCDNPELVKTNAALFQ